MNITRLIGSAIFVLINIGMIFIGIYIQKRKQNNFIRFLIEQEEAKMKKHEIDKFNADGHNDLVSFYRELQYKCEYFIKQLKEML